MSSRNSSDSESSFLLGACTHVGCSVCMEGTLLSERSALQAQIVEAEQLLARLKVEEKNINQRFNKAHDPFTAKLPLEIVFNIFLRVFEASSSKVHARDTENDWYAPIVVPISSGCVAQSAMELAFVCRSWRNFVFSIPKLWTSVEIDLSSSFRDCDLEVLECLFSRSGCLSLRLSFTCLDSLTPFDNTPVPITKYWRRVFDTALKSSHRWVGLKVCLPHGLTSELRTETGQHGLKRRNLNRLSIGMPAGSSFDFSNLTDRIDIDWGCITHLHVDGTIYRDMIMMSFANLTHLRTAGFSYQDIFATLRTAPMLSHLTIDDISDGDFRAFESVIHTRLEYLEIHRLIEINVGPILDLMSFPGLHELIVYDTIPRCAQHSDEMPMTLDRVLPKSFMHQLVALKRLEWHALNRREWAREAVDMLETVPSLQDLEIKLIHDSTEASDPEHQGVDALMEALSQDAAPETFLPQLRTFSLSGEVCLRWSNVPLLFPRGPGAARPLGKLSFDFDNKNIRQDSIDSSTLLCMKDILDRGFSLIVGEGPSPGSIIQKAVVDVARGALIHDTRDDIHS